ncbi:tyrosine-type recombinase/integrase [Neobacillus sp. LXY-1]|uniref:tyrosine-type recombinase/integrase n=1 Tax=Neobacillus sp. LXY-1 TaxID=3379133 RepID=UPI003EE1EAFC
MPDWYMEELKLYQFEWKKEKLKVGELWEGEKNEYLFHAGYGKPLFHNSPTQKWIQFIKKHNLKRIRLHDLSHTMVTLLIEAGTNIKAISKRARHKNTGITSDIYGHITKKVSRETADKFDRFDPRKKIVNSSSTR